MANGGEVRSRGADNTKRQMLTGFGIAVGWAFTWTCAYFLAAVNDVGWVVAVWYIAQAPSTVLFYPLLFATSNGIVVVTAISTLQGSSLAPSSATCPPDSVLGNLHRSQRQSPRRPQVRSFMS